MTCNHGGSHGPTDAMPVWIPCRDCFYLGGDLWRAEGERVGTAIINPATGVLARYYHRYATFLARQGFDVLTYDYRGIGGSRPADLRSCSFRWRDWGELDFEAVVAFARARDPDGLLVVIGHSIGGFLPGFAGNATAVDRMLTVGAQYAYCGDYAAARRSRLFWKWHVVMPALTLACGYFPGRRLGWLENLPAGVANEWSFRRKRMEDSYPKADRSAIISRFAAVQAPILAVSVSDDELGTPQAVARALGYYRGSVRSQVLLRPEDLAQKEIGHFGLFHSRHSESFWPQTARWLRDGANPWDGDSDA